MIIEGYLFIALCLNWPPMVFPSIKQDYGMKFMVTSHIWYPRGSMYGAFTYMKTIKPNCRHIWHAVILCVWEYVFIFSNPSNKKQIYPPWNKTCSQNENGWLEYYTVIYFRPLSFGCFGLFSGFRECFCFFCWSMTSPDEWLQQTKVFGFKIRVENPRGSGCRGCRTNS